jgi:DNA repair exonuclease SbcCD ATPase subunit
MIFDAYRRTVDSDKINKKLLELTSEAKDKVEKLDYIKSNLNVKADNLSVIQSKLLGIHGRVNHLIEQLRKNKERITEYSQSPEENAELIDTIERDSLEILNRISTEITELNTNSGIDAVINSISNVESTSKLLNNYVEQINSIFSNLSSAQLGALGHIFFALSLYYCVVSIASSYYGDVLIIKFKLEEKYPRLAK